MISEVVFEVVFEMENLFENVLFMSRFEDEKVNVCMYAMSTK